jgi:hypothetical protein
MKFRITYISIFPVVFVARSSFIIRGMGTLLGKQIRTASRWQDQASRALRKVNPEKERATVEAS